MTRASIPFDKDRAGFVLGEGAGIVVLEELEHAKARGAKILAEVIGYGSTSDAYHITSPAEDGMGAANAMKFAMKDAGIKPSEVDYINAHGTFTHHNDLYETRASLVRMQNDIILSMADTVEDRDSNTGGHIRRTSECVRIFAEGLQKNPIYAKKGDSFFECVIKAAPLHDFGKVAVDDAILRKPGKFTPEEYEIMKTHPDKGAQIVAKILHNSDDIQFRKIVENVAHYHHEKWDGTGYPAGLSGEEIPLEARIMALADVFDALVSKRCYKEKYTFDEAFSIIKESLGKDFDAEIGKIFIQQRPALEAYYEGTP